MLADYADIIAAASEGIRERHRERHNEFSQDCENWGKVGDGGEDCQCVAQPLWWDENGVPRFAEHHPKLCPDIYATEVVLLRISCQSCDTEFEVQMSWSQSHAIMSQAKAMASLKRLTGIRLHVGADSALASSLEMRVKEGSIHYGDPPRHEYDGGRFNICGVCAGDTMNCWDLKVMEFWRRGDKNIHDWHRVPELEIDLPDMQDEERKGA